jgi:hypothetical protein
MKVPKLAVDQRRGLENDIVSQGDRRCDGLRQPCAVRIDDHEIEAARQDSCRLSAQSARRDRHRGLFDTRPDRRCGIHATYLGRAEPGDRAGVFHGDEHADAARLVDVRSVGRSPCVGCAAQVMITSARSGARLMKPDRGTTNEFEKRI